MSSKSLSLKQAVLAAAVMEFLGAVLVGARVTSTIKDGIIPASAFQGNAGVQLLAFTCAIGALVQTTTAQHPVRGRESFAGQGERHEDGVGGGGVGVVVVFVDVAVASAVAGAGEL